MLPTERVNIKTNTLFRSQGGVHDIKRDEQRRETIGCHQKPILREREKMRATLNIDGLGFLHFNLQNVYQYTSWVLLKLGSIVGYTAFQLSVAFTAKNGDSVLPLERGSQRGVLK